MNFRKTALRTFCILSLVSSGLQVRAEESEQTVLTADETEQVSETVSEVEPAEAVSLGYTVHLSNIGWIAETPAGTATPEGRIEAITIGLSGIGGSVIYQTHVQNIGWMNEVNSPDISGTTGKGYQAEAVKIRLSGEVSEKYDIWYRTKPVTFSWLDWTANGEPAGTEGYSTALQSIEIRLLPKGDTTLSKGEAFLKNPEVTVRAHVQNKGWMSEVKNGNIAGTTGQSLRMEALIINLPDDLKALGNIQAEAHVQDIGWMSPAGSGAVIGTTGRSKQMEALRISLTGQLAEEYDVNYRVHVQNIGWLGWTSNGETAGTTGYSLAIEAVQVAFNLKGKGSFDRSTPASYEHQDITYQAHTSNVGWQSAVTSGQTAGTPGKTLEALTVILPAEYSMFGDIRTEAHIQDIGWTNAVGSNVTAGTTGQAKALEGIKMNLTGNLSNFCDIYYRVYAKGLGWLGWTKNGGLAGSEGCSRAIEAIQIDVVHKKAKSYPLSKAYTTLKWNDFTDVNSILLCANKKHKLPAGYEPADLVVPNVPMNYSGTTMKREAASALERMFAGARNAGITLRLGSGYRSEAYQRTLYNGYVAQYGVAVADTISSRPGYSDHQTGLAADISDHDGRTYLTEAMENTPEGRWLRDHAHEYGFIMRYPKGKQAITGYAYEPWHFRYVGVSNATAIYNVSVWYTFEEYFGVEGGDYY